ncbi:6-phospho-beta-glucosidase [Kineosphaera limosa]|uniref:Putative glycoside hydrolase n=1 Tax=Kineosphaera limosa NBRC 100340 TaxID=1184609 RepID=K6X0P6_9MICO|nr:6-phospho-beta-glucosidase [Kineosphaera limosa]NYE00403.1 6-phospho-beta-glucosidase [Kineosphaera limosa]GAB97927.1 putative glycoside hydrolase [Kineosphaera limosa NBRC 100340]
MRLTILGGGGFRVPLVYGALLDARSPVTDVVLYDTDGARLAVSGQVLRAQAREAEEAQRAPRVHVVTDLDEALTGTDLVFSAIRVGGLAGRIHDERVALDLGVLGQETVGPGGIAFGLRTVPEAVRIAERIRRLAPKAWVVNFTNPAGMITRAMQTVLGDRVVGICDSPIALTRRAARALGLAPAQVAPDYVGLNHLGWLRGLRADGRDLLPRLLADDAALLGLEEGRLFGPDWLRTIGALPNEYLYYFYCAREALAGIAGAQRTRGEYLREQQEAYYAAVEADPGRALATWRQARAERDASYMQEARAVSESRDQADLDAGGYEGVALTLMAALRGGEPARMILGVRNGTCVPGLPADSVVEVPCLADAAGVTALAPTNPPSGHPLGLMQQVAEVEALTVHSALTGDDAAAVAAFALHPLVGSVATARALLAGYRAAIPEVDAVFAER